jgi:hypothetical protein
VKPSGTPKSLLRGVRIALGAFRARRARHRGDTEAYRRAILRIVDLAFAPPQDGPPAGRDGLRDCIPIARSRGGFFSCLLDDGAGRRRFVKCIPARSREVRFWDAWARGEIRAEGRHYRLLPPEDSVVGRYMAFLIFPDLGANPGLSRRRTSRYASNTERVVRAIADFNSDHLDAGDKTFAEAPDARTPFVPMTRRIIRALAVDRREARRIARALRRIAWRWRDVRKRLDREPRCLSHMDLGPGNILMGRPPLLLDFGHAAVAPIGADLHTVLRYGRKGGSPVDRDALVETYAQIFEAKGIAVDRAKIRLAAETHFAARYRNLRLASAPDVFGEALRLSQRLIAAE